MCTARDTGGRTNAFLPVLSALLLPAGVDKSAGEEGRVGSIKGWEGCRRSESSSSGMHWILVPFPAVSPPAVSPQTAVAISLAQVRAHPLQSGKLTEKEGDLFPLLRQKGGG